jgi:hypothetical protein
LQILDAALARERDLPAVSVRDRRHPLSRSSSMTGRTSSSEPMRSPEHRAGTHPCEAGSSERIADGSIGESSGDAIHLGCAKE